MSARVATTSRSRNSSTSSSGTNSRRKPTRARRAAAAAAAAMPDAAPPPLEVQPPKPPPQTRLVKGLRELLSGGAYDGIFLDQFGVLHDGRSAYPRAAEAVRRAAAEAGCRVVVVSNSSRRSAGALARLEKLGFHPSCFFGAVTSGEVAHAALELKGGTNSPAEVEDEDAGWALLSGEEEEEEEVQEQEQARERPPARRHNSTKQRRRRTKVLHLTWAARASAGGGISLPPGYTTVGADVDAAELIVAHGTEGVAAAAASAGADSAAADASPPLPPIPMPLAELEALLARAAARPSPPPMVVANPDFVTVDGPGKLAVMPGTLARAYGRAGGRVVLMGKPSPRIYRAARALAAKEEAARAAAAQMGQEEARPPPRTRQRWLAIGDSLEHDVAGAAAAAAAAAAEGEEGVEVDALFVAAGIHADELGFEAPAGGDDDPLCNEGMVGGAWASVGGGGGGEAPAALGELCARLGVDPPAYATGYLQW